MASCSAEDCNFEAYADSGICSLHAIREEFDSESERDKYFGRFRNDLILYICNFITKEPSIASLVNQTTVRQHLTGGETDRRTAKVISATTIEIENLSFPERVPSNSKDYLDILGKLVKFVFIGCEIYRDEFNIGETKYYYEQCNFHTDWDPLGAELHSNINEVLCQSCVFHKNISAIHVDSGRGSVKNSLFAGCTFMGELYFENIDFLAPIFVNPKNHKSSFQQIIAKNCSFSGKFVLDNCEIGLILLEDSYFDSKFEFKNNSVKTCKLHNTNIKGLLNCYQTTFESFRIYQCIIEDFAVFQRCEFGCGKSGGSPAKFIYATFGSFVNFQNTKFVGGLNIESINVKQPPNFLHADIGYDQTNRETYRIIKDSFDKCGNHIEANKYFALEMRKYKEEIRETGKRREKFIFNLNHCISRFGQDYVRPGVFLLIVSLIHWLLICGYKYNILYVILERMNPKVGNFIAASLNVLNSFAMSIPPFNQLIETDMRGMALVSIFFNFISAVLIWQTIVAVKRHTRR
jgi:hypothetical protein